MPKARNPQDKLLAKAISQALGLELRRQREICGLTREETVRRLPSGIGERTLLAYERGVRQPSVIRLMELCGVLGVEPSTLLALALQRARLYAENTSLFVDLHALLQDNNDAGLRKQLHQWACNALKQHKNGVVRVTPAAVENLALFIGCGYQELMDYIGQFVPDYESIAEGTGM